MPAVRGREAEIAVLGDALGQVGSGQRAVVLIEGEAGIGKTRLLDAVLEDARRRGMQVAPGRAEELEGMRPFGLMAGVFGCARSSPDSRRAAIGELLSGGAGERNPDPSSISSPGSGMRYPPTATPRPRPGEALVRVDAFSVNRGEMYLLEQRAPGWQPGKDIAGVVVQAAADGTGPADGQRVTGHAEEGGWAQYAALPATSLAVIPESISAIQAAALPLAGLTALRLLRVAGNIIGRRILLTGAGGWPNSGRRRSFMTSPTRKDPTTWCWSRQVAETWPWRRTGSRTREL